MGKLILVLAYAVPVVLLVSGWLVWGQRSWFRLLVLLMLPVFYISHFKGLEMIEGWPSDTALPEVFELLSSDVVEPNMEREQAGQIHIWAKVEGQLEPRAFLLPYDRDLHEMLFRAKRKLDQGIRQQGRFRGREKTGDGVSAGSDRELEFGDVPPRVLPPKTGT